MRRGGWGLAYLESPGDPERPFFARRLAGTAGSDLEIELVLLQRMAVAQALTQLRARDRARAQGLRRLYRDQGATHVYQMLARMRRGSGGVSVVDAIARLT